MTLEDYLVSDDFQRFQDETLYLQACQAVEAYLNGHEKRATKSQLYAIPAVIQGGGLSGLRTLGKSQKEKNTKEVNKKFWEFLYSLVDKTGEPPAFSLVACVREELMIRGLWQDETGVTEKIEQKRLKKENQKLLDAVVEESLAVYFEDFTCQYFYQC